MFIFKSSQSCMLQFAHVRFMTESSPQSEAVLEVVAPDSSRERVGIYQSPFLIGGGGENDNNLQLSDGRISRRCAAIVIDGSGYRIDDRGNRYGLFVNGAKVQQHALRDGDVRHLRHRWLL